MGHLKFRLIVMNFLQFAVWGSYLTSMGAYLATSGQAEHIGLFYAVQGIVSLFMPAVIGIIADRLIQAQKLLGICHGLAAIFMAAAGLYAISTPELQFGPLFTLYTMSVAFYMPTIALSNSVAYTGLEKAGLDTVTHFPPIRIFGTIGFICAMWLVDLMGFQTSCNQFFVSAVFGVLLAMYSFTLPECPVNKGAEKSSISEALGLNASGCFFADYKRFCKPVHPVIRRYSGICGNICRSARKYFDFTFPDFRNIVYPSDSVCFETFRYQESYAYRHVCMGIPFRFVRIGRPGIRRMDVRAFNDCIRCGI